MLTKRTETDWARSDDLRSSEQRLELRQLIGRIADDRREVGTVESDPLKSSSGKPERTN